MTSLAAIGQSQPTRPRLFLGIGLFTSGAFLTALGTVGIVQRIVITLGFPPTVAFKSGLLLGGLVIPVAVLLLLRWLPTTELTRRIVQFGTVFIGFAIAGFLFTSPAELALTVSTTIVLASYSLGLMVLLGALLGTIARETTPPRHAPALHGRSPRSRSHRSPSYHYASTQSRRSLPTDGGEEENDLAFPLDDNSPEK